jgi:hypothetical protein
MEISLRMMEEKAAMKMKLRRKKKSSLFKMKNMSSMMKNIRMKRLGKRLKCSSRE